MEDILQREKDLIKSDLRNIKLFCSKHFPFAVIPLSYMRIIATQSVETCGVDEAGTFYVNPVFWGVTKQRLTMLRFLVIHEMMHVALLHPLRSKKHESMLFNIAADAKINCGLMEANVPSIELFDGGVTMGQAAFMTKTDEPILRRMSTEEIVHLLKRRNSEAKMRQDLLRTASDGCGVIKRGGFVPKDGGPGSIIVQEGGFNARDEEAVAREWRRVVQVARSFSRSAGNMPLGIDRLVDEVLEVRTPWEMVLRIGVRSCDKLDTTFAYPNRRSDDLPGQIGYRHRIWALVDTSGSVSQQLLARFLGILKREARLAQLIVMPWDAVSYDAITANKPADIERRVSKMMKGGGGTAILPALKAVRKKAKKGDALVVLTDGCISDILTQEVKDHFKMLARIAGFIFIGYTEQPVSVPGATSTMISAWHDKKVDCKGGA